MMFCFNRSARAVFWLCLYMAMLANQAVAQNGTIDSLSRQLQSVKEDTAKADLLNALANEFYDIKIPDSIFLYGNQALSLSEDLNYTNGLLAAYTVLSSGYWYISDYEQALSYANQGKKLGLATGNSHFLADNTVVLGLINSVQGNYEVALAEFMEALNIAEENNNLLVQSRVTNNIGFLYINTGDYQAAINPLLKSIEVNKVLKNYSRLAINYNNIGNAYRFLNDYENAFKYLEQALTLSEEINYQSEVGVVLRSFGEAYLQRTEYDKAQDYTKRAIALQRTLPSKVELIRTINLSGSIYLTSGNNARAIRQANEALALSREVGINLEESRALETLHQAYKNQGNHKLAYQRFQEYMVVRDSLFSQEKSREIGRLESKAALDRQAQENERLLIENELNKAEIDKERARATTFVIITASLVLLVVGSFYVIRNKQKSNDIIMEQNEALAMTTAELSASNEELNELSHFKEGLTNMIAHDMKNSLNSIIGYSANDLKDHRMSVIHQSGQNILNLVLNMLDVQRFEEAKVQLNRRKHSMNELMAEAKDRVQLLAAERNIKLVVKQENLPSIAIDGELIMRVIVNLLTNAIKYSEYDSVVTLSTKVTQKNGKVFLTTAVVDEGEGISEEQLPRLFDKFWQTDERQSGSTPSTGLGLTFCKLAVESHHGEIYAKSEMGKGTTIAFDLPLPKDATQYYTPKVNSHPKGIDNLTLSEQEVLTSYAQEIQQLKIYQVKALKEVIDRLESEIETDWSKELMAAVFEGSESRFQDLIKEALPSND